MARPLDFTLPKRDLEVVFRLENADTTVAARLSTVLFEPDLDRVTLRWTAATTVGRRFLSLDRVLVRDRVTS